jgi:hypothetical protein
MGDLKRSLDFQLIVILIVSMMLFSAAGLYGIYAYQKESRENPGWVNSPEHKRFISKMNGATIPAVVLLFLSLALCIPKRVFNRYILKWIAVVIGGIFAIYTFLLDLKVAFVTFMVLLIGIQTVSLLLIIYRKPVFYRKSGHMVQIGSALLHLGITILILYLAVLSEYSNTISVFWIASILFMGGSLMSFYGK